VFSFTPRPIWDRGKSVCYLLAVEAQNGRPSLRGTDADQATHHLRSEIHRPLALLWLI